MRRSTAPALGPALICDLDTYPCRKERLVYRHPDAVIPFLLMVPLPTTETDEYERLYEDSFSQLASLPVLMGMPATEAEELIDSVLLASLYRCRANRSQWLVAALTTAAIQKEHSA